MKITLEVSDKIGLVPTKITKTKVIEDGEKYMHDFGYSFKNPYQILNGLVIELEEEIKHFINKENFDNGLGLKCTNCSNRAQILELRGEPLCLDCLNKRNTTDEPN